MVKSPAGENILVAAISVEYKCRDNQRVLDNNY